MNGIKGVIFDFNGTLLFDTPLHEQAWQQYAVQLCGRALTEEEFRDSVHGRTNAEILRFVLGRELTEEETAFHAEAKEAVYRSLCLAMGERFRLAAGAEEFLDWLQEQGVPMAVATSSGKSNADFYRERLGLDRWFDGGRFVYNDGSLRSKPFPDMYQKAAALLGLSPGECVIFEDMPSGIAAARAAGAGRITAVASGLSREYLAALHGVSAVIGDYTEVVDAMCRSPFSQWDLRDVWMHHAP